MPGSSSRGISTPAKHYPLLLFVYGGRRSQTVRDAWGGAQYLWHQMLAQDGYLVASVDNRGTGGRGAKFMKMTYSAPRPVRVGRPDRRGALVRPAALRECGSDRHLGMELLAGT